MRNIPLVALDPCWSQAGILTLLFLKHSLPPLTRGGMWFQPPWMPETLGSTGPCVDCFLRTHA